MVLKEINNLALKTGPNDTFTMITRQKVAWIQKAVWNQSPQNKFEYNQRWRLWDARCMSSTLWEWFWFCY